MECEEKICLYPTTFLYLESVRLNVHYMYVTDSSVSELECVILIYLGKDDNSNNNVDILLIN